MSRHRSSLLSISAIAMLAVAVMGCGSSSVPPSSPRATPASSTPSPTPISVPVLTPAPLDAPLMIQVENLYAARPQSGLSSADILYEYDTEGGISRFTGIWFTPPPASDKIGPVRSARLVSLRLLQIYEGALLYSGASNYTQAQLSASNLHWYNPNSSQVGSTVLYRISSRSAPHNLYSDGSVLATFLQNINLPKVSYQLWKRTSLTALPTGGTPVTSFSVPLSQAEHPIFTYEAAQGAYERDEPGGGGYPSTGVLDDADTSSPWEVPNVVVLQVPVITVAADNENSANVPWTDGLDFEIGPNSSGPGQLAVGGQLYPITWTQGATGPPQLTLADGQAAPIAPGQVLFELVSQGSAVTVLSPTPAPTATVSPTASSAG